MSAFFAKPDLLQTLMRLRCGLQVFLQGMRNLLRRWIIWPQRINGVARATESRRPTSRWKDFPRLDPWVRGG